MLVGAIADDLTGATDLGLMLVRAGLRVIQCVGVPQSKLPDNNSQAIIVSLKSRTIPPEDAVSQSLAALAFLVSSGANRFMFKYCSTFDSTDQGNIGPVIDALMNQLGETRSIACPAMPANGRTVYQGHLFVGCSLLSESSMKDHPLTPMRDANLVRVLQRQSRHSVSLVPHELVAKGAAELEARFSDLEGVAIVDAIDDADLIRIGKAARNLKLVTGGSGIGLGLAANFPPEEIEVAPVSIVPASGDAVVLAGSCSAATRRQIALAAAAGVPTMRIFPASLHSGETTIADAVDFVRSADGARPPILYSSAEPDEVAQAQQMLGQESAGALIEQFLAEVARVLLDSGTSRFIVAGGETSGAVTHSLGADTLIIGPEIDPGVPWTSFKHRGRTIALCLKSGNFGSDNFLLKAWDQLK